MLFSEFSPATLINVTLGTDSDVIKNMKMHKMQERVAYVMSGISR